VRRSAATSTSTRRGGPTRTYLGDGAWDQRASAELGYRFIAIGRALEHEPRFDDYRDRDAVLACLAV